jgi:hypothetical protein
LTRRGDDNPTLGSRAGVARNQDARVFVSLHANAGGSRSRGAETWVHERAGSASQRLAASVQGSLSRLGGPNRGVRRGPLAVLTPDRLAARTAACLVEVDFLSDPEGERRLGNPNNLEHIARAIADGVRGYMGQPARGVAYGRGRAASRALDEPYFTDEAQLDAAMNDSLAADTRVVSQTADAVSVINGFAGRTGASPWTSLGRAQVASRLIELVNNPRLLKQGRLNLCGPAAFLVSWAKRDPVAFATWAAALFDDGFANIGSISVAPGSELLTSDYAAMVPAMGGDITQQADWMVMGALRNATNPFWQPEWRGNPDQEFAGLTRPEEVADWLRATGIYSSVSNEANWATTAGIPHATGLQPGYGKDVIMLLNTNALVNNRVVGGSHPPPDNRFLLNCFPNHFAVLVNSPLHNGPTGVEGDQTMSFNLWTWGVADYYSFEVPRQDFLDNYYGAIVATLA